MRKAGLSFSATTLCACSHLHRVVTAIDSTLFPPFLASPKQMPPACDPLAGFVLDDVFTPERLTSEHRLIARTTADFVANEVLPQITDPLLEARGLEQSTLEVVGDKTCRNLR